MKNSGEINPKTYNYLRMLGPKRNRQNVIGLVFILLDLLGVLPLLSYPRSMEWIWAGVLPAILINIWGVLYIFAPYKYEKSYFLFVGVAGFITSYVYFLVIQKFLYAHMGVESILFFAIGAFFFILLMVSMFVVNQKYFFGGSYYDPKNKGANILKASPYLTSSGIGYIVAQILMSSLVSDSFQMTVLIIVLAMMSVGTAFFATFIHRFFFIHKYEEELKSKYHDFGLPKKYRKQQYS